MKEAEKEELDEEQLEECENERYERIQEFVNRAQIQYLNLGLKQGAMQMQVKMANFFFKQRLLQRSLELTIDIVNYYKDLRENTLPRDVRKKTKIQNETIVAEALVIFTRSIYHLVPESARTFGNLIKYLGWAKKIYEESFSKDYYRIHECIFFMECVFPMQNAQGSSVTATTAEKLSTQIY